MLKKYLNLQHLSESALILICLIALFGAAVYRFYALNNLGLVISLILAIITFIIIQYFYLISNKNTRPINLRKPENGKFRLINFILYTLYFILAFSCFYILFKYQTANAIVSPWQAVPKYFFAVYILATLSLLGNLAFNKKLALPLIMLHYFLSFSIALIIYKLGYGYDSFIHQATEKLIAQTGAVSPKPFYYLGQYSLIVILHKIFALPVIWLDKLILPLLAAVFLPIVLWRVLKDWLNSGGLNLILILAVLALSFPFLIVTTPQNLAYLFLLLALLLGLSCKNFYDFLIIFLLSAAAAVTHALAGIPALLYAAALAVYHSDNARLKKYFYPLLFIALAAVLPALFYFLNRRLAAAWPAESASAATAATSLSLPNGENFILNAVYLYGFNLKFIFALLALGGIMLAWRYREQCKILLIYLIMAAGLLVSYFISLKLPFAFLINYERDDYPQRILLAAALFLLPFVLLSFYWLIEKVSRQNIFVKSSWAVFLALTLAASLYISYPRHDNYFNSRGYSVASADISAVNWINQNAQNDYIVLANQQVSAAALSQYGFKKYYYAGSNQLFYYPIPTSSLLYQYYLDMAYKKPSRETMFRALDLAGVKEGYFVLNKYWWAFKKILDEAKLSASSWQSINNGEVYVFKYKK